MSNKINAAVFPVAGFGSRFLPATKATPKEMLPVVDKPLIQYAVEEAIDAGIRKMIFVTGRNKRAIEDHFDKAYELENELEAKQKFELLNVVRSAAPKGIEFVYVRQTEALGLGHAIMCAKSVLTNEDFAVLLADDLIKGKQGATRQLIEARGESKSPAIALHKIDISQSRSYGIAEVKEMNERSIIASGLVEKPIPSEAPSDLAVVGRYILPFRIFNHIRSTRPGAGSEIQLTDALDTLAKKDGVIGVELEGRRFDCGSKLGYVKANVEYGLDHPDIGNSLKTYIRSLQVK